MGSVRKLVRGAALFALGGLVLVGVTALVAVLVRRPLRAVEILASGLAVCVVVIIVVRRLAPGVKKGTIVEVDLAEMPAEAGSRSKLAELRPSKQLSLDDTIAAIARAAADPRVAGLILRPRFEVAPRASLEELRNAVVAFGKSGKFSVAITDSFGEGGPANGAYLLATACKEIVVQPSGYVGLTPLDVEGNFYPDVLARAGVSIDVFGRGEYKSAPNQLTERGFTAPDREQTQRLLDCFWDHQAEAVAQARAVAVDDLRDFADKGPLSAAEALDAGLVDRIAFPDEATDEVKKRVGDHASLLYLHAYKKKAGKKRTKGKTATIAVIRAAGEIHRGGGLPVGLRGGPVLTPEAIAPHIRAAVKDKSVKAIVVRIDSPGGSALASDSIWRELMRARAAGKPVVASMANVAASGGYYIAAAADRIVALPTTITGSIGVFAMRPMVAEAKQKLRVHTDEIHTGTSPSVFSINRRPTAAQRERIDASIDSIYDLFLTRVGDGRGLERDDVLKVARGRVWTGGDAVGAGLVDELGGLDAALAAAVKLTDAAPGTKAKAKSFPKKTNGALALMNRKKPESSEDPVAAAASLRRWSLQSGARVVAHLGFDPRVFWIR